MPGMDEMCIRDRFSVNLVSTDMLELTDYFGSTSGHDGPKADLPYAYSKALCVDAVSYTHLDVYKRQR